jgi:hypothetical protein
MELQDESVSLQDLHDKIIALVDALMPPVSPDADDFGFVESVRQVLISVASCNARTKTKETAAAVRSAGANPTEKE